MKFVCSAKLGKLSVSRLWFLVSCFWFKLFPISCHFQTKKQETRNQKNLSHNLIFSCEFGIDCIAQTIAKQHERQHDKHNCDSGKNSQVRITGENITFVFADHHSP